MESRIKQLRENRGLIQEILASELGITQHKMHKRLADNYNAEEMKDERTEI